CARTGSHRGQRRLGGPGPSAADAERSDAEVRMEPCELEGRHPLSLREKEPIQGVQCSTKFPPAAPCSTRLPRRSECRADGHVSTRPYVGHCIARFLRVAHCIARFPLPQGEGQGEGMPTRSALSLGCT